MINIINFDSWKEFDGFAAGSGRSEKIWLVSEDKKYGLFKFPKIDPSVNTSTTEHISEHLASRLGDILSIPTAKVDIGTRDGRIGCMSYLVCEPNEALIEGINFISGKFPDFNAETMYDSKNETYYCIEHILDSVPKGLPITIWTDMMVFDFLIGNSDRHQSNWALLLVRSKNSRLSYHITQCPLYDNGSSLCCYVNDSQIDRYNSKDLNVFDSLVDTKSKSLIRIDGSKKTIPTHKQVITFLLESYPAARFTAERFVDILDNDTIENILSEYPDELLSNKKRDLIKRYLCRKIEILNDLLEKGDTYAK